MQIHSASLLVLCQFTTTHRLARRPDVCTVAQKPIRAPHVSCRAARRAGDALHVAFVSVPSTKALICISEESSGSLWKLGAKVKVKCVVGFLICSDGHELISFMLDWFILVCNLLSFEALCGKFGSNLALGDHNHSIITIISSKWNTEFQLQTLQKDGPQVGRICHEPILQKAPLKGLVTRPREVGDGDLLAHVATSIMARNSQHLNEGARLHVYGIQSIGLFLIFPSMPLCQHLH